MKKIFGKMSQNPTDGDIQSPKKLFNHLFYITDSSYEKLLALFVGSYFVNTLDQVIPRVTDTDTLNTRDNLGE